MTIHLPTVDQNVIAAITAAGGAIFVKVIERWIGQRSDAFKEGEKIRQELRDEVNRLQDENSRLRSDSSSFREDADKWREKYWEAQENSDAGLGRIKELESDLIELRTLIENNQPGDISQTSTEQPDSEPER